jgi:hypothetical protein
MILLSILGALFSFRCRLTANLSTLVLPEPALSYGAVPRQLSLSLCRMLFTKRVTEDEFSVDAVWSLTYAVAKVASLACCFFHAS